MGPQPISADASRGGANVNSSDAECIRACAAGHIAGLATLVDRYERPLAAVLRARLANRSIVDDVTQETFVRAYHAAARKRDDEPVFPWLVGIALRVAMEHSRQARSAPADAAIRERIFAGVDVAPDEDLLQSVERLAEPYRLTVLLRYFGQCSCAQIAEYLELPIGTVTKRLSRAHALLRETLSERDTRAEVSP
jgi:RNA polymerase sigma factor (sigma-70 family)